MTSNAAPGFATHPGHTVTIEPFNGKVSITIGDETIVVGAGVMSLAEKGYQIAYYLPKSAFPDEMLEESSHTTYCPFKGEASYYDLVYNGERHENAVWTYRAPYEEASLIRDKIAIYPNVAKVSPVYE